MKLIHYVRCKSFVDKVLSKWFNCLVLVFIHFSICSLDNKSGVSHEDVDKFLGNQSTPQQSQAHVPENFNQKYEKYKKRVEEVNIPGIKRKIKANTVFGTLAKFTLLNILFSKAYDSVFGAVTGETHYMKRGNNKQITHTSEESPLFLGQVKPLVVGFLSGLGTYYWTPELRAWLQSNS